MHAVTMPVYVALHCQVSGARMALTHCVLNQRLIASLGPRLKGNVAVYKGLFLELPSGHVIIITVYTFPSVY